MGDTTTPLRLRTTPAPGTRLTPGGATSAVRLTPGPPTTQGASQGSGPTGPAVSSSQSAGSSPNNQQGSSSTVSRRPTPARTSQSTLSGGSTVSGPGGGSTSGGGGSSSSTVSRRPTPTLSGSSTSGGGSTPAGGGSTPGGGGSSTPAGGGSTPAGGGSTPAGGGSTPAGGGSTPAGGGSSTLPGGSTPGGGVSGGTSTLVSGPSGPSTPVSGPTGGSTGSGGSSGSASGPSGGVSGPTSPISGPSGGVSGPSGPTSPASGPSGGVSGPSGPTSPVSGPTGGVTGSASVSGPTGPAGGSTASQMPGVSGSSVSPSWVWGQSTSTLNGGSWNSTTTEKSVYETLKTPWIIAVMSLGAALFLILFALLMYWLYRCCVQFYCPQQPVTKVIRRRRIIRPEPEPIVVLNKGQVLSAGQRVDAPPHCHTMIYQEPAETFSMHSVKLAAVHNVPAVAVSNPGSCCQLYSAGSRYYDNQICRDTTCGRASRGGNKLYGPTVIEISDDGRGPRRGDRSNVSSYHQVGGYLRDNEDAGIYDRVRDGGTYGGRTPRYGYTTSIYNR